MLHSHRTRFEHQAHLVYFQSLCEARRGRGAARFEAFGALDVSNAGVEKSEFLM